MEKKEKRAKFSLKIANESVIDIELDFAGLKAQFRKEFRLDKAINDNMKIVKNKSSTEKKSIAKLILGYVNWGRILSEPGGKDKINFRVFPAEYIDMPIIYPGSVYSPGEIHTEFEYLKESGKWLILYHDYFNDPDAHIQTFLANKIYAFHKKNWLPGIELESSNNA